MEMTYSTIFWKYALLSLNIVVSLAGVALISCGVVSLGGAGSTSGAYLSTLLGFVVFTICFVGCCAALRESYILSMAFIIITMVGLVLELIFMITFVAFKDDLTEMMAERVQELWEDFDEGPEDMNNLQMQYHCCGKDSPQDYLVDEDDKLPESCCINSDCSDPNNIFARGCVMAAVNFFDDQSDYLILTIVGAIALEVLGIVSAYFLAKSVQNRVAKVEQIVISEG